MIREFKVKWTSRDKIAAVAERFLQRYHPTYSVAVPIDPIVEFSLGINIIPVPGLKQSSKEAGLDIDAFISSDLNSITVDQFILEQRENRYRFTLAHEVAHMLLHGRIYKQYEFVTLEDWISTIIAIQSTPQQQKAREWAEWQADELAGFILVPRAILEDEFKKEREQTIQIYSEDHPRYAAHSDRVDYQDFINAVAIRSLAQDFVVSEDTMRIRLEHDGLIEQKR